MAAVTETAVLPLYRPEQEGPQEWHQEAKVRYSLSDHPGATCTIAGMAAGIWRNQNVSKRC